MAYRKIIIAVDCDNDQEQQVMQSIAQELSATFNMKAKQIISFYPMVKQHKTLLYNVVKTVASEGKKGFAKVVPMILKNI